MDHFHNVAGNADKKEGYTSVADRKLENNSEDTALDINSLTDDSKVMKSTTSDVPDQAQAYFDAVPSATPPTYPQENT
eukprot:UN05817